MYKVNIVDTLSNCRNYRFSKTGYTLANKYTRQECLCHKHMKTYCTYRLYNRMLTYDYLVLYRILSMIKKFITNYAHSLTCREAKFMYVQFPWGFWA